MGRLTGRALSEFYASADVFVFPSTTDTFGIVLLEAMASGLPVVGADVGPTRELLAEHTGVTFPPDDAPPSRRASSSRSKPRAPSRPRTERHRVCPTLHMGPGVGWLGRRLLCRDADAARR